MDNPWANAWDSDATASTSDSTSAWANPLVSSQEQEEADLSSPSWSAGPGIDWNEPTESHISMWKSTDASIESSNALWTPRKSPYENITFDKPFSGAIATVGTSPTPTEVPEKSASSDVSSHTSPVLRPSSEPSLETPDSPTDVFGTFEVGTDHVDSIAVDPWSIATETVDTFSSPWEPHATQTDAPLDEWEAARQQKERQDRFVPPELLNDITERFRELSKDVWPTDGSSKETFDHNMGLDSIAQLNAAAEKLIPQDLTLTAEPDFSKLQTAHKLSEAMRLTRYTPSARASPLALYAASKGSTTWEMAVKSQPEEQPDAVPTGWRILKKEELIVPSVMDKRASSGASSILSFFGRRRSATPPVSSPTPPSRHSSTMISKSSMDTDADSIGCTSSTAPSLISPALSTNSANSRIATPAPAPPLQHPPAPGLSKEIPMTDLLASFSSAEPDLPPTPPSAVSRFFSRFSKKPKNASLALSSGDLEFLSDIEVGSDHGESASSHSFNPLQGPKFSLDPNLESTAKLPKPLAPPPRAPPLVPSRSMSADFTGSQIPSHHLAPSKLNLNAPPHRPTTLMSANPSALKQLEALSFSPPPFTPSVIPPPPPPPPPPPLPSSRPLSQPIPPPATINTAMTTTSNVLNSSDADDFADFQSSDPTLSASRFSSPVAPPSFARSGHSSFSPLRNLSADTSSSSPRRRPLVTEHHEHNDSFSSWDGLCTRRPSQSFLIEDSVDDFEDFVSSPVDRNTLRTPSPPRPPAKPSLPRPMLPVQAPLPPPTVPVTRTPPIPPVSSTPVRLAHSASTPFSAKILAPLPTTPSLPTLGMSPRPQRQNGNMDNHRHTLGLLETAAARPGRWPAPLSPTPPLLPPPPGGRSSRMQELLSFDVDDFATEPPPRVVPGPPLSQASTGTSSNSTTGFGLGLSLAPSPSRPSFVISKAASPPQPPPGPAVSSSLMPVINMASEKPAAGTSSAQPSGLSAQDLFFFESL